MKTTTIIAVFAVLLVILSICVGDFTHFMEQFATHSAGGFNFSTAGEVANGRSMSSILGVKN